jgi:diketogulonate reductase-like aldo/keto reductase
MSSKYKAFGWTDVKVPTIGMGTWMIEGSGPNMQRLAIEALKTGLELGMTHIDTAEMYGNGRAEEVVAQAIAGEMREKVFLVSKVLPSNASYEGTIAACNHSLKRLKTKWLDLYLLHWPSSQYPVEETMRAMEKLVDEGMIRFIGVSNFDVDGLRAAESALSKYRLVCNQVPYHLSNRSIEKSILPYCAEQRIAVVGYSPFGHRNFPSMHSPQGQILADIAERHNHTPRQVALNFLTRHTNVFTIPKASNPDHIRENSGGMGWTLTTDDMKALDNAFPA